MFFLSVLVWGLLRISCRGHCGGTVDSVTCDGGGQQRSLAHSHHYICGGSGGRLYSVLSSVLGFHL